MKSILLLLMCHLSLFHISETKKCRVVLDDQVLPYEIDKSVSPVTRDFSLDDFVLEQVDDDSVLIGGVATALKTMDPNLTFQMSATTQFYAISIWNEAPIKLYIADMCKEMVNPNRFFYNFTKLFKECPAKVGDIWPVENQIVNVIIDMPPSMPLGMWKVFGLFTQGIPGREKTKFGFGFKFELIPIN